MKTKYAFGIMALIILSGDLWVFLNLETAWLLNAYLSVIATIMWVIVFTYATMTNRLNNEIFTEVTQ